MTIRPLCSVGRIDGGSDAADRGVEFGEEAGVERVAGVAGHFGLGGEFFLELGRRGERDVDGVVGDLKEKRLSALLGDEIDGAVGEVFRSALWRWTVGRGGLGVALSFVHGLPALLRGAEAGAAEMPFAKVTGAVAGRTEALGQGLDLKRELAGHDRIGESRIRPAMAGDVLRNAEARLVLTALKIRARRRADGAGVELGEAEAIAREAIEVGRFVKSVPVTAEVGPAQIVGEDDDEVGLCRFGERVRAPKAQAQSNRAKQEKPHGLQGAVRRPAGSRRLNERTQVEGDLWG
ncbi:MAG: hypothetical protein NTZ29_10210 [Verrucomicrobia bacterium]|nr:hypothetical protein [Verrucomicrobiota bacterium]